VKEFARGSMRTYMLLRDKVRAWQTDPEIKALLKEINRGDDALAKLTRKYTPASAKTLLLREFDRNALADRPLPYERLDQLTMEVVMGVR